MACSVIAPLATSYAAAAQIDTVTTNAADAAVLSHLHPVSGTDRLLIVAVQTDGGAPSVSVTFAGQPLTLEGARTHTGGKPRVEVWSMPNPPLGLSPVVVGFAASQKATVAAVSYTAVSPAAPTENVTTLEGNSAIASVTVASQAGDLVQDVMASVSAGIPLPAISQNLGWDVEMGGGGSTGHYGAGSSRPGAPSVEMQWALQEADKDWVGIGFNINTAAAAVPTNYYVSPTGNDLNDGLSPATAWRSIEYGDAKGMLLAGDTINVMPGTYARSTSVTLTSSGALNNPIVYRRWGRAPAVIDLSNADKPGIDLQANYLEIHGLTITNTKNHGIEVNGGWCHLADCRIIGAGKIGIHVDLGDNSVFLRNVVDRAGQEGIKNEDNGSFNEYYHNVIYRSAGHGIELRGNVKTARLFNNIVAANGDRGITGPIESVCGFNNVWGNPGGNYVGVADSAGGISNQPKFVDPAAGRFDLKVGANEIHAGLDLGHAFNGPAPDMGAVEKYNGYFVSPAGNNSADGRSIVSAWASIGNGDTLLLPGDTVYVLAGTYSDSVVVHDGGSAGDDLITFKGERGATVLDGGAAFTPVRILAPFVRWQAVDVADGVQTDIHVARGGCTISDCRITGAGQVGLSSDSVCHLSGNVFAGNGQRGATVAAGNNGQLINNTFYDNGHYGYYTLGNAHTLINNIFVRHDSAGVRAGTSTSLTYGLFHNNAFAAVGGVVVGFGSQTADPLLIDPDAGDFRLASPSPAIDAGTDVGRPYLGPAPDLGAYETGVLASLAVVPLYDSLFADSSYPFDVIALDSSGAPAGYGTLAWSHTFATGNVAATGVFTPQGIGAGKIIARSSVGGVTDTSGTMNVVAGELFSITVAPNRDTLSADSTRLFTVTGRDRKGNLVADVGTLAWNVVADIGGIDASGLFSAGHAGKGFIRAVSSLGPIDQSDTIVVVPGTVAWIDVVPPGNSIIEDSSFQYAAAGHDADSNLVLNLTDSASWSTDDPGGSITPGGLYTAGPNPSPPLYYVRADWAALADSGAVSVLSSGSLSYIQIERPDGTPVGDTTLTTDVDSTQLYCRGYSSADSLLGDVPVTWFLIGDSIGGLTPASGTFTELTLTTPGTSRVVATYASSLVDTTGLIICGAGVPAELQISPDSATVTADSTLAFVAASLDLDGNPSDPVAIVSWSVLGGIGTINGSGQFVPGSAGIGSVVASGAGLADTAYPVTVVPGALSSITMSPDSVVVSADSMHQFAVSGHDGKGNLRDPGAITWSLTAPLGTIDSTGAFDATTVGNGRVVAQSDLGPRDTNRYLGVAPGRLVTLTISPDSVEVSADGTAAFVAVGRDAEGNLTGVGTLTWQVQGGVGDIDATGKFTPSSTGVGQIVVTSSIGGVTDTTRAVVVTPGILALLNIVPDTAVAIVGDTLSFSAVGYDADFNPTAVGNLSWQAQGGIGTIDSAGAFTATASGTGAVSVQSDIGGVVDTSGNVIVEALAVSPIPIGNLLLSPGCDPAGVLAFHLANPFGRNKQLSGVRLRDVSRGLGTQVQRLANMDSLGLFMDLDNDSLLSAADSALAWIAVDSSVMDVTFAPVDIAPGSGWNLIAAVTASLLARDGDSLDLRLDPATDFTTVDGTTVDGGVINSFGYGIIDGLVARQIGRPAVGADSLSPGPAVALAAIIDLPRNGYQADTLFGFSIDLQGTAGPTDFDSLILYRDGGDGTWGGAAAEARLGRLVFTGSRFSLTGLSVPLVSPSVRFFVGAKVAQFATNDAIVHFHIPTSGIEMASGNDGPIDLPAQLPDSIPIRTFQALSVSVVNLPARTLVPGLSSGPLLGLQLANSSVGAVGIDSMKIRLISTAPAGASQAQLDSQIDSLRLFWNRDGDHTAIGAADSLLATATLANGVATFGVPGFSVAGAGGQSGLTFTAAISAPNARNGNTINLRLADSTDLYLSSAVKIAGSFPLQNGASFTVDAFPAARVTLTPLSAATFFGGQMRRAALQFNLPGNGYAADTLRSLRLGNVGSLTGAASVIAAKLWRDWTGDGLTADDSLIKIFTYSAPFWEATAMQVPIGAAGLPLVVTVDVADQQFEGGTLSFAIPTGGVEYRSGTTGPDDAVVVNPQAHLVLPSNRVTAISVPTASVAVAPGTANNLVFSFALYNGYPGQTKTLNSIRLTNSTRTQSTPAFGDQEIGQVSLFLDSNRDRILNSDSLIGTGLFAGGQLQLTGLAVQLAPESLSYFFVVLDLPDVAIDADSLAVSIRSPSDFTFADAVLLNGDLPLSSGAYLVIDGSVREQYELLSVLGRTLGPGDTAVTVLAFRPASNGDQVDTLQSVTVSNALTADSSDLSRLVLWQDQNGDGQWQATDQPIAPFTYIGGAWTAAGLNLGVSGVPPALFVLADVSASATPDVTMEASLGIGACQYASGNDGPRDGPITSGQTFTVSNSGLRIASAYMGIRRSVGQPLTVRATVTNILGVPMDSVIGSIVTLGNPATVSLDSAAVGPSSLAPAESVDFVWYYTTVATGTVYWDLQAQAPTLPDSSSVIRTHSVTVQNPPNNVLVKLLNSVPAAVTRGQRNVFPLSITYSHPDTSATSAPLELDSLALTVADGSGVPQSAGDVFSRLVLSSGFQTVATIPTVPAQSTLWLHFTEPVVVDPGESVSYSLLVDIDSMATAGQFTLGLQDASSIPLADGNTRITVPLAGSVTFPLFTASCRIDDPSRQMAVSSRPVAAGAANLGQVAVDLLRLYLRHPGPVGSSQIQLSGLYISCEDSLGGDLVLGNLFEEVRLRRGQTVIGQVTSAVLSTAQVEISLGLPITLGPNQLDSIDIEVDMAPFTPEPGFRMTIRDSSDFVIRDLSSGSPLSAGTDTVLATGVVFPIASAWTVVQSAAAATEICLASTLPTSIVGGLDSLHLIDLALTQPAGVGSASVRVDLVRVRVLDSLQNLLDPRGLFDRIGFAVNGAPATFQPFVDIVGGATVFRFTDSGLVLAPGDSAVLSLVADIEVDVPYDHFGLEITAGTDLLVWDATDTTRHPGLVPATACTASFPFNTAFTQVFLPAGRPLLGAQPATMRLTRPGQPDVELFSATLDYRSTSPQADVALAAVRAALLRRTDAGLQAAASASVFSAVRLLLNGVQVAADTVLSADSVSLLLPVDFELATGDQVSLAVRADIAQGAVLGNYLLRFADSTALEMADRNLGAGVYPILTGAAYPLMSADLAVAASTLENSFDNFPNPFIPSRGEVTTFRYNLPDDAYIDLALYTITGAHVATLVDNQFRAAGSYGADTWSGSNREGGAVVPGVYFARITARFTTGAAESFRRKVAVLR